MIVAGYPGPYTAHVDRFARDNLPPPDEWPVFMFDRPEVQYPDRLNCASALLDAAITEGYGERTAIHSDSGSWSYSDLLEHTNRIANVLVTELGVVPGNRVLLRGFNSPMLAACWLAVIKTGAIAVATMPLLRAKELAQVATKARIDHALCDARLVDEVMATSRATNWLSRTMTWGDGALESAMLRSSPRFLNAATSRDDVCLLAFTSGTTGEPKATAHFHRDVLVMADIVARHLLKTSPNDVYAGTPPLGFTFGLGALLVFPLRFRAATVMIEQSSADAVLAAVDRYQVTSLFTAPTMYRSLLRSAGQRDLASLCTSVSAGEPLPKATSDAWHEVTGIRLIDGLGTTEMIHIFISASGAEIRPGATGKPLPGYEAVTLDDEGKPLPAGQSGRLAVRGPTGCRYLADRRQREYVINGWNLTGDRYVIDDEGYFWFQARADDMIVSAGYNIAGPEVEAALIAHKAVREVAVIGALDEFRGQIVKAFIVLDTSVSASAELALELQEFVKSTIAAYKYPRAIEFVASLPKTATGKTQRYLLRQQSGASQPGDSSRSR
jgi:2-aminobenzoate-CoA ligase